MVKDLRRYNRSLVVTKTPLRISLAGGGTDLAAFYEREHGAVLSTAIDKYIYVTVKQHGPVFDERIRLNYSKSETVQKLDEIENNIVRESLRFLSIDCPIYVSTVGDLPASSGLGGSGSFAVGLLNALHAFKGESVPAGQLAEEASHIEIEVLREPIGKQDQYASAFGGLNVFCFKPGGIVTVEPHHMPNGLLRSFFKNLMMFWTGHSRDASCVLSEQKENTPRKMKALRQMRGHAYQLQSLLSNGHCDVQAVGRILDETWQVKSQLASTITNSRLDTWYSRAKEGGALGGKVCGAGGGGFLLFVVPPDRHQSVRDALCDLTAIQIGPEVHGSKVLFKE